MTVQSPAVSTQVVAATKRYPRLRFMGSKYRLLPHLERVFAEVGGRSAVDAFSGSGVVSYLLKQMGFAVTSNDFLHFTSTVARACVENSDTTVPPDLAERVASSPADDRDFIARTFAGLYLTDEDLHFLDSAWSHIDLLGGHQRDILVSSLVLAAARKQPRGVFTFTDPSRYADGRRSQRVPLRELFLEAVQEYNAVVFDNGHPHRATCGDVFDLSTGPADLVYLDPPYAPPRDDADYIKRYHFLEGLSVYWQGLEIMERTKTKKLPKRFTPFAYKRHIEDALMRVFEQFSDSGAIVLSYSTNSLPGAERIQDLLGKVKPHVEIHAVDHRYSFGTHAAAVRRDAQELIFVGRD